MGKAVRKEGEDEEKMTGEKWVQRKRGGKGEREKQQEMYESRDWQGQKFPIKGNRGTCLQINRLHSTSSPCPHSIVDGFHC